MLKKNILRNRLSYKYIKRGKGIEIGPTFLPLSLLPGVQVKYVDTMSKKDLLKTYPDLKRRHVVEIDVIDDGEKLERFKKGSLDFIIANHFIEHTINPVKTIIRFLEILKDKGIIFLAIPDRRATFDRERDLTPVEHFIQVYRDSSDPNLYEHYLECVRLIEKKPENEVAERADELIKSKYSIHYHTFQQENFVNIVDYLVKCFYPINLVEVENLQDGTDEFIVILQKNITPMNKLINPLFRVLLK